MNENEKLTEAQDDTAGSSEKKKELRKLRFGSMSVITIVLVIAIVIVVNLMAGILARRVNTEVDLTPDKRYELTEETENSMKELDKEVEITVTCTKDEFEQYYTNYMMQMYYYYRGVALSAEDCPYEMVTKILERYQTAAAQGSGKITLRYVDMNSDPDVIAKYKKYYSGDIEPRSIIVYSNERVEMIDSAEIVSMFQPDGSSTSTNVSMTFAGESTITSAIMNVTDSHPIRVAYVSQMNGASVSEAQYEGIVTALKTFIAKNGYDCTDIDLAADGLDPADYDMVILPVPAFDLTPDMVTKLTDFLYNGGNYERDMLYIPSLMAVEMPNLDDFLADWSIEVGASVVMNDSDMQQVYIATFGTYDNALTVSIADSDSVGKLPNDSLPIVAPYTRPINVISKNNSAVVTPILTSGKSSYLVDLLTAKLGTDTGSFNAAVISKKETASGLDVLTSNVMVIGSSFFGDEGILAYSNSYNNANVLLNMLNTMTGKENAEAISEKALQQSYIAPSQSQYKAVRAVTVYVIPLLVAAIGVFILIRRRNR